MATSTTCRVRRVTSARLIVEAFESRGIHVEHLVACGGLAEKSPLLMQIYADVTGRDIKLAKRLQTCSAMDGAVAAGCAAGGRDSIFEAAQYMARLPKLTFKPGAENHAIYD